MFFRFLALSITLFGFWLVLSGQDSVFLLSTGVAVSICVAGIALRMKAIDNEGYPIEWLPQFVVYLPWLLLKIVQGGIQNARIILSPKLPISPTMFRVHSKARRPVGVAIFANSITLIPGTFTAQVKPINSGKEGYDLIIHALTQQGASALSSGELELNKKVFLLENKTIGERTVQEG
jgi:multicomponent Na+:H+ antiporter subunit E